MKFDGLFFLARLSPELAAQYDGVLSVLRDIVAALFSSRRSMVVSR